MDFYSENVKTGKVLRVEMEELILDLAKEMSKKTGKRYVYKYNKKSIFKNNSTSGWVRTKNK